MVMPDYLYHASTHQYAKNIAKDGLEPRSGKGGETKYLCMSGKEGGAVTLGGNASDIIFRVLSSDLTAADWSKTGAGKEEWRSITGISGSILMYRRNLGTAKQVAWKSASTYSEPLTFSLIRRIKNLFRGGRVAPHS